MWLLCSAVAVLPVRAGLVFEREVATETAAPSEETHESKFVFKNAGSKPVTISEVQSTCGCLGASTDKLIYQPGESGTVSATIKLGTFEGEVIKSIYVLSDDEEEPKRQLQMKITIPRLMEVLPEVTTWAVGEEAKPKKLTVKVLRDQPIVVTAVSSTRENFTVELVEVEKGRAYEVIMTPKTTAEPTLGAVKIETDCELSRYKNRLAFFNVVRPRRPAAAAIPAPGAATTPVPAPPAPGGVVPK
jgi:hypothetical protein